MKHTKNTIIRASAGSGKTYQLSNRFLQRVFDAPSADKVPEVMDTILASTFTRKAAGEITDRIITKFAAVALDSDAREQLRGDVCYPESVNEAQELQERLAILAKNLYRLRVGTIDSYFSKVARAFELELGLPPGWSILDDSQYDNLLTEAIREVLEDRTKKSGVEKCLTALQQFEGKITIVNDVLGIAKVVLPLVRVTPREAWQHDTAERLQQLLTGILSAKSLNEQLAILETLPDNDLPQTKDGKPNKTAATAISNLCDLARNRSWDTLIGQGIGAAVLPALKNENAECKFSKIDLRENCPKMFEVSKQIVRHAVGETAKSLIAETLATYDLIKLVGERLDAILVRERKFRFDDITRKVAEFKIQEKLDSLNHRLNTETRHLLLDEFQDTSISQWDVIEPVAGRTVQDEGGTFFCVGDIKQAIYSWRGGVAAIFDTMKATLQRDGVEINEQSQDDTRRCTQPIIDSVNAVFGAIGSNDAACESSPAAVEKWQGRFNAHTTHNAKPGYCTLEEVACEATNKSGTLDACLEYAVDRVAELHRSKPSLKNGIGVLVFKNDTASKIVTRLKEKHNLDANGRGMPLVKSHAVRHILSALILADHPSDTFAQFHLAHGPLAATLGLQEREKKCEAAEEQSRKVRESLLSNGYGETIKGYIAEIAPLCNTLEFQCLEKLLEIAYRFDEGASGIRTERFIALVRESAVDNPNAAAIQVMTIFSAKGLEFDIVVLPELDRNLYSRGDNRTPKYLVEYETPGDPTSPINFVIKLPKNDTLATLPKLYTDAANSDVQRKVEESLSVLYVAMTRAIHQLVLIVPQQKSNAVTPTFAGLLRLGLNGCGGDNFLYEHGDANWCDAISATERKTAELVTLDCAVNDRVKLHHVRRIAPSSLYLETTLQHEALSAPAVQGPIVAKPSLSIEERALWGTAIHACFNHAPCWLDECEPITERDDKKLRIAVDDAIQGETPSFTAADVVARFRGYCQAPAIVAALSKSRYSAAATIEVERERPFVVWLDGQIMRGTCDRVVVQRNAKGIVTEIEILDFKTDSGTDIQTMAESHLGQMHAYRQGMAALFKVDPSIVKATLIFVELGEVVRV